MKVAYCLSGFLRNYKNNNFFENMISKVPGDVFIHTWSDIDPGIPLNKKEVIDFYNPKKMMIDHQSVFKMLSNIEQYPKYIQNYVCLWASVWSCVNLASTTDRYDVIVRVRPDFIIDNEFSKDEIIDVINNQNVIYFGASKDCYKAGILTDNFAFGSQNSMINYSNNYLESVKYRTENGSHERAMSAYIYNNMKHLHFKCSSLRYTIRRMNGDLVDTDQTVNLLSENWIKNG